MVHLKSLIGFLNVVGAMNGQPQLELDIEKLTDAELVTSTFIPEPDEERSLQARINFNFSPSVGFAGDRFVISSTRALARELIETEKRLQISRDDAIRGLLEAVVSNMFRTFNWRRLGG